MKKTMYVVMAVVLFATLLSSCGAKTSDATLGAAVLTVKGDIGKTNSGSNYVLDQAAFDSKSVELTYNDPWMGDGLKYKGILLKDLITLVKPASRIVAMSFCEPRSW